MLTMVISKSYVHMLLLCVILLNLMLHYPVASGLPLGSDTYLTLDLSRHLVENEQAAWTLDIRSYIGLFPASYPSGTIFINAETEILSGMQWNSVPWIVSVLFSLLLLLGGFVFLRTFGVRDDYAVVFSGIMSLSPLFLYFTYGQLSPRGFIMPIMLLALSQLFMVNNPIRSRVALFIIFTLCALTIHRSSYVIPLLGGVWFVVSYLVPSVTPMNRVSRKAIYLTLLLIGALIILGPFLPAVNSLFGEISEISVSYRLAELEFGTGLLFTGDSPLALLGNLAANYVGSIGLVTVLFPLSLIVLYPSSRVNLSKKYFLLAVFLAFSLLVWNAQYTQLILMPFFFITGALVLQKRRVWIRFLGNSLRIQRTHNWAIRIPDGLATKAVAIFLVCCVVFSIFMFHHRMGVTYSFTGEGNQPSECTSNLGVYLGASDGFEERAFVANSGLLERRIRWISGWDAPVSDVTTLLASGYLHLEADDFILDPGDDVSQIAYFSSFYKPDKFYRLDSLSPDYEIASLSWGDIYGFLRLYYQDQNYAIGPRVSTNEAGISVVITMSVLGDRVGPRFTYGVVHSPFLEEVMSETYVLYQDSEFQSYLAATPEWS